MEATPVMHALSWLDRQSTWALVGVFLLLFGAAVGASHAIDRWQQRRQARRDLAAYRERVAQQARERERVRRRG